MVYIFGILPANLKNSKIPTNGAVLGRFLSTLESSSIKVAAAETRNEVKEIWKHHFGSRLVEGREFGIEEVENESKKIIRSDKKVDFLITGLWKKWKKLEKESRRASRASGASFIRKQEKFKQLMKKPFNICKNAAEEIIKESGIKAWLEETEYLRNQLSDKQPGCLAGVDNKQKQQSWKKLHAMRADILPRITHF